MVKFRVDLHWLGPDEEEFSVEVHHGGFFCGTGVDRVYLHVKVDWFDHVKVKYWSFTVVDEITLLLGYDLGVLVFWLLPELDLSTGLRLIESDKEAQIMKQVAFKVRTMCFIWTITILLMITSLRTLCLIQLQPYPR